MSKPVSQRPVEIQSGTWPSRNDLCHGTGQKYDDESMILETSAHIQRLVQRLNLKPIGMNLESTEDKSGPSTEDEIIDLRHHEILNLSVFEEMLRSSGDCQIITEDLIERCKFQYSHASIVQVRTQKQQYLS